jgi:hypothetical protein
MGILLVLVCGTRAQSFSAPFSYSLYKIHNVSKTGSASVIRCKWGKDLTQLGPLEGAGLDHWVSNDPPNFRLQKLMTNPSNRD